MRVILTLVVVLITAALRAQHTAVDYYRTTNEAELAICRRDLPAAAALYAKAFAINPDKPFTLDLMNAYYCAMDLDDYPTARTIIRRILQRGVSSKSMGKLWANHSVMQWDSIRRWLQIFRNDTLSTHRSVRTIRVLDSTNWYAGFWASVSHPRGTFPPALSRELEVLNQLHAKELSDIFRADAFPNEAGGSTKHVIGGVPVFQRLAKAVIRTSRTQGYGLDTLLFQAVLRYDYHPRDFMDLLDATGRSHSATPLSYLGYQFSQPFIETLFMIDRDSTIYPLWVAGDHTTGLVDSQRRAIGLETLDERYTKLHFSNTERTAATLYVKYAFGITGRIWTHHGNPIEKSDDIREFERYMSKQHQ